MHATDRFVQNSQAAPFGGMPSALLVGQCFDRHTLRQKVEGISQASLTAMDYIYLGNEANPPQRPSSHAVD
jgi:hypothetical protein